jgi:hypothetical protein
MNDGELLGALLSKMLRSNGVGNRLRASSMQLAFVLTDAHTTLVMDLTTEGDRRLATRRGVVEGDATLAAPTSLLLDLFRGRRNVWTEISAGHLRAEGALGRAATIWPLLVMVAPRQLALISLSEGSDA